METTRVAGLDQEVSRIGLGTWAIGGWMWGGTDEQESIRTIHAALDRGINLIDTAPVYGFGRSEEIVGRALAQTAAAEVVISTKAGLAWDDAGQKVWRDSRPERLQREVEDSLRRLGVETIDIYHVHWPDGLVPFEKTAATLAELRQQGKIRALAVSNYDPRQMEAFRREAPLHVCQPPYNLFERGIEHDVLPYCRESGVATLTYGALCRGLLSGRMHPERQFEGDDLRRVDPKFQQPRFGQYLAAVDALDALAQQHGKRVIDLALRWLLDRGASVALWGARRPDQLAPVSEVADWSLGAEDMQRIDAVLEREVSDPVGPEFMAPPHRDQIA